MYLRRKKIANSIFRSNRLRKMIDSVKRDLHVYIIIDQLEKYYISYRNDR